MALVNCNECDNQVSDSAKACPKCGAAVKRVAGAHQMECPFCCEVMNKGATFCPSCRAQKGYMQSRGRIYGRLQTVWFGIVMPIILFLVASAINPTFGGVLMIILALPILMSIYRLITGGVWYQKGSVN